MANILVLNSSVSGDGSVSKVLVVEAVRHLMEANRCYRHSSRPGRCARSAPHHGQCGGRQGRSGDRG
jgi:hypothetical protein